MRFKPTFILPVPFPPSGTRWVPVPFWVLTVLLAACAPATASPARAPTATRPIFTPVPTFTATAEPPALTILSDQPGTIVMDFVARACEAKWSNNAYNFPCPGDLTDTSKGYIEYSDHTIIEGMVSVSAPVLIGLPGQGGGSGIGLFGHYPSVTMQPGDRFISTLACQGDALCDVEFALEYFDRNGTYHAENRWRWQHQAGDGPLDIDLDLTSLAGQTVDFMLVVREKGPAQDAWTVWIHPRILRDPNAQPLPTNAPAPTADTTEDKAPGLISGWVDMSTAPPYLNDPVVGSSPVVVTFFNLDDGTYWYIQTSLTGHPNYQMTVTPGNYQVVAYGRGVGDTPYVAAGYTGENPSCGQALKPVNVEPNARVNAIVIADWNWTCGGTAERPSKPADVPIP